MPTAATSPLWKDEGLVAHVFDDRSLAASPATWPSATLILHDRFVVWANAQPVIRDAGHHEFALGHNGNLTNTMQLADDLGMLPVR